MYITEVKYQKLREDSWTKVIENLWGKNEAALLRGGHFGRGMTLRGYNLRGTGHLTQVCNSEYDTRPWMMRTGIHAHFTKNNDFDWDRFCRQLLWAETERVGCGKIIFENNGGTSDLRTCDYGEG